MDLQSLRVFLSAAEYGSFSQAGEELFLTQPAVSKRMAALEEELGVRLFDRIGRRMQLTEAGRALLPRAHHLWEEAKDIRRSIANLSGEVAGELSLGTSHHIGLHRLPPVLKAYTERHLQVRLDIRFSGSESVCRQVERGRLELGIVTLPPEAPPNIRMQVLWDDPLHIAVGREHPLASASPSLDQLVRFPAVLPSPDTYTRNILEQALARQGLALHAGMTTDYLETLKMLAVTGLGWALLPATMLDSRLSVLEFPGLALRRRLGLVAHAQRSLSNAARAMWDICEELRDTERTVTQPWRAP
jgi:DNA-binding transcriptional LysR family regulator